MVHALEQAWQVLRPGGILIDLRPLAVDMPLELLADDRLERAGSVDLSAELPDDQAADQALDSALRAGLFVLKTDRRLEVAYFWDRLDGLLEYAREQWPESAISEATIARARKLAAELGPAARFRVVRTMRLATYGKPGRRL